MDINSTSVRQVGRNPKTAVSARATGPTGKVHRGWDKTMELEGACALTSVVRRGRTVP